MAPHCHHHHDHQVEQREEGEQVSGDSLALVQRYNDIIGSLTEAFFQVRSQVLKLTLIKDWLLSNSPSSWYKLVFVSGGHRDHKSREGGWHHC